MAVSSVVEAKQLPASIVRGLITYKRQFRVRCAARTDSAAVATGAGALALGLPAYGSVHPDDSRCYNSDIQAEEEKEFTGIWLVTYTYTNEADQFENPETDDLQPDPDDDPPVTLATDTYDLPEVMEIDAAGTPVLNTAGDPYDPPLMRNVTIKVIRVAASATAIPAWFHTNDVVNDDDITFDGETYGQGYVLFKRPESSADLKRNAISYRRYSYELHIRTDRKWNEKPVLSVGFRYRASPSNLPILDDDGNPVTAPVPLDVDGAVIPAPTAANVYYQYYAEFAEGDLTVLPGVT